MKYLSKLNKNQIAGKVCLLRVDFNLKSLDDTFRIDAILPTIKFLLSRKAKVLILSHRGRPDGAQKELSLKPIARILSKRSKKKVVFLPDFNFSKIKKAVSTKNPAIFMLENLRFLPGEEKNDIKLAKNLADLGDFYVNDAFAVCHRKNASVTAIAKYAPSYAGLLLEKEIAGLQKATKNPAKPLVVVLGGTKIADKVGVIKNLDQKTEYFLFGSSALNEINNPSLKILLTDKKCILPVDSIEKDSNYLDIGPQTASVYENVIKTAKTIIWNGPVGNTDEERYSEGSEKIALAITSAKAFTVAGGGETANFIIKKGLQKKISLLSTGGGAMLDFLAGKKLPGIEALK